MVMICGALAGRPLFISDARPGNAGCPNWRPAATQSTRFHCLTLIQRVNQGLSKKLVEDYLIPQEFNPHYSLVSLLVDIFGVVSVLSLTGT
jgi:hypothetical protein